MLTLEYLWLRHLGEEWASAAMFHCCHSPEIVLLPVYCVLILASLIAYFGTQTMKWADTNQPIMSAFQFSGKKNYLITPHLGLAGVQSKQLPWFIIVRSVVESTPISTSWARFPTANIWSRISQYINSWSPIFVGNLCVCVMVIESSGSWFSPCLMSENSSACSSKPKRFAHPIMNDLEHQEIGIPSVYLAKQKF